MACRFLDSLYRCGSRNVKVQCVLDWWLVSTWNSLRDDTYKYKCVNYMFRSANDVCFYSPYSSRHIWSGPEGAPVTPFVVIYKSRYWKFIESNLSYKKAVVLNLSAFICFRWQLAALTLIHSPFLSQIIRINFKMTKLSPRTSMHVCWIYGASDSDDSAFLWWFGNGAFSSGLLRSD